MKIESANNIFLQARQEQEKLRNAVITEDQFDSISHVAGCDISCNRFSNVMHAGLVCLQRNDSECCATSSASSTTNFPYVPGFLGFREVPTLVDAFHKLSKRPDLIFVDGQGISHPRGFGVASHLGVTLDIPTIGVGKSILIGKPAGELGPNRGDTIPLLWQDQVVGMLLRSKPKCLPLVISIGHKISLPSACNLVLEFLKGYRLPEPTRLAHKVANAARIVYHQAEASFA